MPASLPGAWEYESPGVMVRPGTGLRVCWDRGHWYIGGTGTGYGTPELACREADRAAMTETPSHWVRVTDYRYQRPDGWTVCGQQTTIQQQTWWITDPQGETVTQVSPVDPRVRDPMLWSTGTTPGGVEPSVWVRAVVDALHPLHASSAVSPAPLLDKLDWLDDLTG